MDAAGILEPCSMKAVQTSECRPAQIKPRIHLTITTDIRRLKFLLSRDQGLEKKHSRSFFHSRETLQDLKRDIFHCVPRNHAKLYMVPVDLNVELLKHCRFVDTGVGSGGGGGGSGRVRLFVGTRGSGRVGSGQRFAGSGRVQEKRPVDKSELSQLYGSTIIVVMAIYGLH